MDEGGRRRDGGSSHCLIVIGCSLLSGTGVMGSTLLIRAAIGDTAGATVTRGIPILIVGLATILSFVGAALLARRRPAPDATVAAATGFAIAGGYVVLEAVIGTISPQRDVLVPLRSRYASAVLRLAVLLPYAGLVAWLGPRLARATAGPVWERLGLSVPRRSTCLLTLAVAALVTMPWPLTGALGDSLNSLAVTVEMLSSIAPRVLVFWGVIFLLLTTSSARTQMSAMTTILIYALSVLGRTLLGANEGALSEILFLLPLALLLTEIRAQGEGVLPLLPLALSYQLAPVLFVDPRDVVARGMPEPQHVLSYRFVALTATVLVVVLWLRRRASATRRDDEATGERRRRAAAPAAMALLTVVAWGVWAGVYFLAGEPGFFNDGFLIILEEQADLESAYEVTGREARLRTVYEALVETAEGSQRPIRRELDSLGISYRSYYIINMIRVDGHRWLMGRFADRPEVAEVILHPNVRIYPRRIPLPYGSAGDVEGVQENLVAIHADAAWQMGARGQGVVVGGQDSGYDWDHPALKAQYRGWDGEGANHNYNWHDAWGESREPFDDGSHGTHTMGTVLGDDGGENRIGVAPEATWIGCRNMRRGIGNPGSYAECMEFLLAPYPLEGDPFRDGEVRLAADVVNNSWGCPRIEGCFPDTLQPALEALRAAGVMMVVSAGNEGSACRTATTPPANYDAAFSVGATDEGDIVAFSSRGPVDGLIKPDIVAPGKGVRSSVPGGGYARASGTSMAAPHVAGTVALVWSVDRSLIGDIDATEELLCRTAAPRPVTRPCADVAPSGDPAAAERTPPACACGAVNGVPNNVYGCGIVDAGAAVREAADEALAE